MRTITCFGLGLLIMGCEALAGIPRAPCTIYGLVKDEYGQSYLSNARIILKNGDMDAAAQDIDGLIGYGINFQLSLDMDNGSGKPYADYAVCEGDELTIAVEIDGVRQPLLETALLRVPAPGSDIPLSLTTGSDSDGDGLPDEWEQQMMAASDGVITNIAQILPGGDFDGDGASNMHEYLAGTFAFLDYDYFAIEELEQMEDGRFIFRFLSVTGKSYGIDIADSLTGTNSWSIGTFSLDADGASTLTGMVGDGYYQTMYIETEGEQQYMRLVAE